MEGNVMKNGTWKKQNKLKVILILFLVATAGFGGYFIYGLYKLNHLSEMT
jgi:hypothetical protein